MGFLLVSRKLLSSVSCVAVLIGGAAATCRSGLAADPYPTAPDSSTIQFAFSTDAPIGTLTVNTGSQDFQMWEQPAYPGGHPTFTLSPGRYSIEFGGDPVLYFVQARPQAITVVTIGRSASGTNYRFVGEHEVTPDQLVATEQGAAPLRELGSVISFKILPRQTTSSR
jgi:hypothetical protein